MAYKKEYLEYFLKNQKKLFDEEVAFDLEEAEEFLEECMAVVVPSMKKVRIYFEESGMDVSGMSDQELAEEAEVFALPDGNYLIVEA